MNTLVIENWNAEIDSKQILKDVNLQIKEGEIHVIMGPNGAGKSTLAMSLMGQSKFKVQPFGFAQGKSSKFKINGKDMLKLNPEKRARNGLFVSFQQPVEVTGVSVLSFLRTAYKALYPKENIKLSLFKEMVKTALQKVSLSEDFMQRFLNEGFSGGERKRMEIVQLLILKPRFAILDEIDSGLDVDSLKIIAKVISEVVAADGIGIILITHYQRILHFLHPDFVHVLIDGKIKQSDGMDLVKKIEEEGYGAIY